jgi:type IV pilus assembly protein PilO
MALSQKERQQILGLLIFVAIVGSVAFWLYWRAPKVEELASLNLTIDTLTSQINAAKRDLARGTVEDMRERVRRYEANLEIMRRLVPAENEVPDLLDDIASRARVRGVDLGQFERLPPEPAGPFTIYRYTVSVTGHYDDIGEFLADVASLGRIMVPNEVALTVATDAEARQFGDTTGALLNARFQVRTFVKPQSAEGGAGATP